MTSELPAATVPAQYHAYVASFLRAMAAITSGATGFNEDLSNAYREHLERYPIDPAEDYDDEC